MPSERWIGDYVSTGPIPFPPALRNEIRRRARRTGRRHRFWILIPFLTLAPAIALALAVAQDAVSISILGLWLALLGIAICRSGIESERARLLRAVLRSAVLERFVPAPHVEEDRRAAEALGLPPGPPFAPELFFAHESGTTLGLDPARGDDPAHALFYLPGFVAPPLSAASPPGRPGPDPTEPEPWRDLTEAEATELLALLSTPPPRPHPSKVVIGGFLLATPLAGYAAAMQLASGVSEQWPYIAFPPLTIAAAIIMFRTRLRSARACREHAAVRRRIEEDITAKFLLRLHGDELRALLLAHAPPDQPTPLLLPETLEILPTSRVVWSVDAQPALWRRDLNAPLSILPHPDHAQAA